MAEIKIGQLTLEDALKEQDQAKPVTLNDGTVLKWADPDDKEESENDLRRRLQRERIEEELARKKGLEAQGVVGLKTSTPKEEKLAREKVANLDTRKKG